MLVVGCSTTSTQPTALRLAREARGDRPPAILMQGHSLLRDPALHRKSMDLMKAAGVEMVRDEIFWHEVEKQPGIYGVPAVAEENLDYMVSLGIEPLIILNYGNPNHDNDMAPHTPEGRAAFAGYCEFMARHFRGRVKYFEIWNEPNSDGFWRPKANPEDYAELVKAVYPAIKRGNPDAYVVAGALSQIDTKFTEAVFRAGALPYMDAWSVHPYITPRTAKQADLWRNLMDVQLMSQRYGKSVPIWITETGYPTHTEGVTEAFQADVLAQLYIEASAYSGMVPVFGWYWFGPDGDNEELNEDRFGLVRHDWSLKPSYHALQTFTHQMKKRSKYRNVKIEIATGRYKGRIEDARQYETGPFIHFSDKVERVIVSTEEPLTVTTTLGREVEMAPYDGKVHVYYSRSPVYMRGFGITSTSGSGEGEFAIKGPDVLNSNSGERLTLTGPNVQDFVVSWEPESAMIEELPASSNRDERQFLVKAPLDQRGEMELVARLHPTAGALPFARIVKRVFAEGGATISIRPIMPTQGSPRLAAVRVQVAQAEAEKVPINVQLEVSTSSLATLQPTALNLPRLTDSALREISIDSPQTPDAVYALEVKATLETGEVVTKRDRISFMTSPRARKAPRIDGDLNDWPRWAPINLRRQDQLVSSWRKWGGPEDASARVYTAWDDQFFCVAAEVTDNIIASSVEGFEMYKNDGLEIYMDADFEADYAQRFYSNDDNQFGAFLERGKPVAWRWSHEAGYFPGASVQINLSPTVEQTISGEPCTYIIESAWPNATLNLFPTVGKLIGFNVILDDDDSPDIVHPFGAEVGLGWNGLGNSWQNPRNFSQLFLVEGPQEEESPGAGAISP